MIRPVMIASMTDVTRILNQIDAGDPAAAEKLLPLVYDELRKMAALRLSNEDPGQTLQATALVHEAYMRLVGEPNQQWNGKAHFFGAAAQAIRRILVESARRKNRLKHGGDRQRLDLDLVQPALDCPSDELLALDEALQKLDGESPEKAKLVKLRFFAGCTNDEAADLMGISSATARRYWAATRAWLYAEMSDVEARDSNLENS